jgi:muramoyltetrapeptide carboxypeptidase
MKGRSGMASITRRRFVATSAATAAAAAAATIGTPALAQPSARERMPLLLPRRLRPGDTIGPDQPLGRRLRTGALRDRHEALQALGFKVREGTNLRARYGHFAGTDAQRAADVNAMFADPGVHGILAVTGGSGGNRILPLIDYATHPPHAQVPGGFSDLTALINAVHARPGWSPSTPRWAERVERIQRLAVPRSAVMEAQAVTLRNPQDRRRQPGAAEGRITTLRGGRAAGRWWAATWPCSRRWPARPTGRVSTAPSCSWKRSTNTSTAWTACSAR